MKYIIFLIIMQISTLGYLSAQQVDTIEFNYFKIVDDALPYAETFLGCGVSEEGYFSLGTSVVNHTKYLSLKKYSFTGELLADLELDNENEGYGQVNYGRCLAQVNETEWVLAYRGIATDGNSDIRVIKFNLEGEVLWQIDLGEDDTEKALQINVLENGKIVVVGETFISDSVKRGYIVLLSQNGELLWEKIHQIVGDINSSSHGSIVQVSESTIIVAGRKRYQGVYYPYMEKLSIQSGELLLEKTLEENLECTCYLRKIPEQENQFDFYSCNLVDEIQYRGKVDTNLNIISLIENNFDDTLIPEFIEPILYANENRVNVNAYYEFHPQYGYLSQLQLFGLDPEGNLEFVTKIPTDLGKEVYARDLRKTPDGGYLIAGYEHFPSPQRGWLIKTDSLGNTCQLPNCDSVAYVIDTVFTSNFDITTAQSGVKIFPNPTQKNGFVNVVLNDNYNAIESSQIFSIDGKQLFFSANDNTNQVPTSNLVAGIYMLKVRTRKGVVYTRRLVVE